MLKKASLLFLLLLLLIAALQFEQLVATKSTQPQLAYPEDDADDTISASRSISTLFSSLSSRTNAERAAAKALLDVYDDTDDDPDWDEVTVEAYDDVEEISGEGTSTKVTPAQFAGEYTQSNKYAAGELSGVFDSEESDVIDMGEEASGDEDDDVHIPIEGSGADDVDGSGSGGAGSYDSYASGSGDESFASGAGAPIDGDDDDDDADDEECGNDFSSGCFNYNENDSDSDGDEFSGETVELTIRDIRERKRLASIMLRELIHLVDYALQQQREVVNHFLQDEAIELVKCETMVRVKNNCAAFMAGVRQALQMEKPEDFLSQLAQLGEKILTASDFELFTQSHNTSRLEKPTAENVIIDSALKRAGVMQLDVELQKRFMAFTNFFNQTVGEFVHKQLSPEQQKSNDRLVVWYRKFAAATDLNSQEIVLSKFLTLYKDIYSDLEDAD